MVGSSEQPMPVATYHFLFLGLVVYIIFRWNYIKILDTSPGQLCLSSASLFSAIPRIYLTGTNFEVIIFTIVNIIKILREFLPHFISFQIFVILHFSCFLSSLNIAFNISSFFFISVMMFWSWKRFPQCHMMCNFARLSWNFSYQSDFKSISWCI